MDRILVVEDEIEIRQLILLHLRRAGVQADSAGSAEEAFEFLRKNSYSLLILDWMLPGGSGIDIAKEVRRRSEWSNSAILMLTARAETADIVAGLEAGADDYLTKPFEAPVFLARVKALLRRHGRIANGEASDEPQVLQVGQLRVCQETFAATCSETPLQLTASEFKLLVALMQSQGRVLTRESLISQVQGENIAVVGRTVDTHVFALRKKLGACSEVIETVRGIGYRVRSPIEDD
jgi:two-component system, OmpR family, phosphate regulon response regulator PhoB